MADLSNVTYGNQLNATGINSAFASNPYFDVVDEQLTIMGITGSPYAKLWPKNGGAVDVVNTMAWKNGGDTDEVPSIFVSESELQYGTWATNLAQILTQGENAISNKAIDSYVQLYASKPTGFSYYFPWLLGNGSSIRNVSNQWDKADTIGSALGGIGGGSKAGTSGKLIGAAAGAAAGSITPGAGSEQTYKFSSTAEQEITIEFPLYNTLSLELAFKHFSFVNLFTFQNLKTRTTFMTFIPPKIYTVDAYAIGGLYMAAAYVSNLKIDSIGTTRTMSEFSSFGANQALIPEAYKVSITFKDLISPSTNIFSGAIGGNRVQVANGFLNKTGPVSELNQ